MCIIRLPTRDHELFCYKLGIKFICLGAFSISYGIIVGYNCAVGFYSYTESRDSISWHANPHIRTWTNKDHAYSNKIIPVDHG